MLLKRIDKNLLILRYSKIIFIKYIVKPVFQYGFETDGIEPVQKIGLI